MLAVAVLRGHLIMVASRSKEQMQQDTPAAEEATGSYGAAMEAKAVVAVAVGEDSLAQAVMEGQAEMAKL